MSDPITELAVIIEQDAPGDVPDYQAAQAMFADNPGLAWVMTDKGNLSRDGLLVAVARGE